MESLFFAISNLLFAPGICEGLPGTEFGYLPRRGYGPQQSEMISRYFITNLLKIQEILKTGILRPIIFRRFHT